VTSRLETEMSQTFFYSVAARILLLTLCIHFIDKDFYLSRDFDLSGGFVFFLSSDTCQVHHIIKHFSSEADNFHRK
jgi:hypothetical protein